MKAKSKSYITSAKTMFAALQILKQNGGTMPIRILMQDMLPLKRISFLGNNE